MNAKSSHDRVTRQEDLDEATCCALLAGHGVGRIAVSVEKWPPVIRPVSYAFDDASHTIVFRSAAGSKLAALLLSNQAAFEVDDVDEENGVAWSVIALGKTEEITRASDIGHFESLDVADWVPEDRPHWFQLHIEHLSGRRLVLGTRT